MNKKMLILLTNDDGFHAQGLQILYAALKQTYRIAIVAPENEQSGISHAFTYKKPLYFTRQFEDTAGVGYIVRGTPADCVKFAVGHLLKETPDIVVSGINDGNNSGVAGYYSGTVGAAREGALWQIPSIAFSVSERGADFFHEYAPLACRLIDFLIMRKKDTGNDRVFYNVNFPPCIPSACAGIKVTRQSLSFYDDHYTARQGENGTMEYWLHGDKKDVENSDEFDVRALEKMYITVTPLQCDATAHDRLAALADIEKLL